VPYSLFAPPGLGQYVGGKPRAQAIHETALALFAKYSADQGSLSTEEGSLVDLFCFMVALAFARVARTNELANGERYASGAYYLLGATEGEHELRPGADDTLGARRRALAGAKRLPRGSALPELEQQLRDLLGDDYVGVHITAADDVDLWPADLGDQPQLLAAADIPRKLVRLPYQVSTGLGSPQYLAYEPLDPLPEDGSEGTLRAGDMAVIGVDNLGRAETVEVLAIEEPGDGEVYPLMRVTVNRPHGPGSLCAAMPFPAWGSSRRHVFIVLTEAAALDAETRRKVNDLMGKIATGVTTWSISPANGSGGAGPLTLDDPVLGRLDMTPFGTIAVP
jgi:hypothetical protein